MAEAAAAHLPERDAAGCHDRPDGKRRLVPHAAGRVLVDDLTTERGGEIDRLATPDHRVGERERLAARKPAEVDGHAERSHLVVRHVAPGVAEDELGYLFRAELLAVAFALNQLRRPGITA